MKSKLKSTISNFLNELLEGESSAKTNMTPNKRVDEMRLAEITKITKYRRNSLDFLKILLIIFFF